MRRDSTRPLNLLPTASMSGLEGGDGFCSAGLTDKFLRIKSERLKADAPFSLRRFSINAESASSPRPRSFAATPRAIILARIDADASSSERALNNSALAVHETEKGFEPVFQGAELVYVADYVVAADLCSKSSMHVNATDRPLST